MVNLINLNQALSWEKASVLETEMLEKLQGNILKGHGRNFTTNIFFNFGANQEKSKELLKDLGKNFITNARTQLQDAKAFKQDKTVGDKPFYHIALSFLGYKALGLEDKAPEGDLFRNGMRSQSSLTAFTDNVNEWDDEFKKDIHAIIIVGHDNQWTKDEKKDDIIKKLEAFGCTIIKQQDGAVLRNKFDEGIEHFGYVDGRSQPLLLEEDLKDESIEHWDARFPLSNALVQEQNAGDDLSFGSFFIFRKLEQNVQAFKTREQEIANKFGFEGEDRELVGAMLVGRFEDGTPVTLSKRPFEKKTVINDFNYQHDSGVRCPVHSHIRKTNPRGTSDLSEDVERGTLFVRRGIPYEDTSRIHPNKLPEVENFEEFIKDVQPFLPTGGVGLLFMAYNNTIEGQFEIMQRHWANNNDFPKTNAGIDPVIASHTLHPSADSQKLPNKWDNGAKGFKNDCPFSGFVKMKGGEFFFSPSLTFLKSVA